MSITPESAERVFEWLAKPLGGLREHARPIKLATFRVAERMLHFIKSGWAEDLGRYTANELCKHDAETDAQIAEANRRQAEAAAASSEQTIRKRQAAMDQLDREAKEAETAQERAGTAKTEAEAEVLRAKAEAIRQETEDRHVERMAEVEIQLQDAASVLRQKGGGLFFRKKNLKDIVDRGLPPPEGLEDDPERLESHPGADESKEIPDIPFIELKGGEVTAMLGSEKVSPRQPESQADGDEVEDTPDSPLDLAGD